MFKAMSRLGQEPLPISGNEECEVHSLGHDPDLLGCLVTAARFGTWQFESTTPPKTGGRKLTQQVAVSTARVMVWNPSA